MVDVQCRQDDATVFVVAFRVRSERVLRRSADGPEPGRGQGLGAPWTPALLTRCEWPGREYLRLVFSTLQRAVLVPPAFLRRGLFRYPRAHPRLRNGPSALVSRSRRADILSLVRSRRHGLRVAPFRNGRIVRSR